jgi:ATP adenylyltransferase
VYDIAMSVSALNAPWRMEYIRSLGQEKNDGKCFLCEAASLALPDDTELRRDRLVLWQTQWSVVVLNRYPYANGHLLVAPRQHKADLTDLTTEESTDLILQTARAVKLLRQAVSAQGFNIGINLGRVAGAGVPGHLHQHVVPRWNGDINFMHASGEVSVVPQANSQLYSEMTRLLAESGI